MSRSGYSDDYADEIPGCLWRQAVRRATFGARGQRFLRKLRDALDGMPTKRLITDVIRNEAGEVCALGALDPSAPQEPEEVAAHFGIARVLASEIVYMNDEYPSWWRVHDETPEQRWTRMRTWVDEQIVRDKPESVGAVDPDA